MPKNTLQLNCEYNTKFRTKADPIQVTKDLQIHWKIKKNPYSSQLRTVVENTTSYLKMN